MTPATRYDVVTLVHVSADIVFIAGMLGASLVLAALSFQDVATLAKERRLIAAIGASTTS